MTMKTRPSIAGGPTPGGSNRRGRQSRQDILEAAADLMARRGYSGTTMSVLVKEAGLPRSAIYHHFGSKAGLLAAVLAQGAQAFFDGMARAHQHPPTEGSPGERLDWYLQRTSETFEEHQGFLRLQLAIVNSPEATEGTEAMEAVISVRTTGRDYMASMIASAFETHGPDVARQVGRDLAHFGMAGFDGAFVSAQSGDGRTTADFMRQLADALAALGEARAAQLRRG